MRQEKEIRVIKIEPHGTPEVITIENNIQTFYKIIGCSMVETIILSDTAFIMIDEEGKLKSNPVGNRRFRNDIIVGTMIIAGRIGSMTSSLSNEDIQRYTELFKEPEEITPEEIKEHSGWTFHFL